ncbi:hypothetical protein AAVH_38727 [Aphelenchoides avenae]|nr:hypothetical protein AAVH_38727 [Aphelenchus avenae]
MFPLSLAVSLALKVDESGLPAVYKNRRVEFETAVKDVVDKNDLYRLLDTSKLEFKGLTSRTPDETPMPCCGSHTVGQHFDAAFPMIKRVQGLPCIEAYSANMHRSYFPFEEIGIFPKMDRLVQMGSLVDVLCDFFRTGPKWLGTRVVDFRNWQAASILLANLRLRTTHLEHNKDIEMSILDSRGSSFLPSYNGHLGVTVRQHFYSRHRIELRHPYLPCVGVAGPKGQTDFYPLEVSKS